MVMRSFATQLNEERRNEYTRQRFLGGALGLSAAAAGLAAAARGSRRQRPAGGTTRPVRYGTAWPTATGRWSTCR